MQRYRSIPKLIYLLFILTAMLSLGLAGCSEDTTQYQSAEVFLDCENYSNTQNDPGNCQVVPGTTSGLRIQEGMVVSKSYVNTIMKDLGWSKKSQTQKYIDINGSSYRLDVIKFTRELK